MSNFYKVEDLYGKTLNVGDKVVFGDTSSTHNAYLNEGEITEIKTSKSRTSVFVKINKVGDKCTWYIGSIKEFRFPRNYSNLVKIN